MVEYDAGEKRGERGYLRLHGAFIGDVSDKELARALEHHYIDDGVVDIVVDLSGVEEISLEGVGILLSLLRQSRQRGKRLIVEHERGQVREKLQITGVLRTLTGG